ncbi:reverse transcriptase domain-containing protein [Jatrophihabitans endophyticus]|uniref:reverse transcriptase domain-containing protein n=1 Tax=Jatrophihabitans endophyticus TaxID=1206085 RepID=UPI0019DFA0F4|nr:reverse transcriptase domain-containing protein [Jatrophihabitans endophyticus]MBE7189345.1 hypothetical protein [Jatrophihabitans endophyticus]
MTQLRVTTWNVRGQAAATDVLFASGNRAIAAFQVVAITEPYAPPGGSPRAYRGWTLVPASTKDARVALYLNDALVSPSHVRQLDLGPTCHNVGIDIETSYGWQRILATYQPPGRKGEAVAALAPWLTHRRTICLGDYNAWNALWNSNTDPRRRSEQDDVVHDTFVGAGYDLLHERDLSTFENFNGLQKRVACLDLIWGTEAVQGRVVTSGALDIGDAADVSDHRPVYVHVDYQTLSPPAATPDYDVSRADWDKFDAEILRGAASLPKIKCEDELLRTIADVDDLVDRITGVIQAAQSLAIPRRKVSKKPEAGVRAAPWFADGIRKALNLLGRRRKALKRAVAAAEADDDVARRRREVQTARKGLRASIRLARRQWNERRLAQADEHNIWTLARQAQRSDDASGLIPTLNLGQGRTAAAPGDKIDALVRTWFVQETDGEPAPEPEPEPAPVEAGQHPDGKLPASSAPFDTADDEDAAEAAKPWQWRRTRLQRQAWVDLTDAEIDEAVESMAKDKKPGDDEISNRVLQRAYDVIKPHVRAVYRACVRLGHMPAKWRHQIIVVLRKPNKPDYSLPKAYRPIALRRTLAKGLEKVIARRLAYYGDRGALPKEHYGGRAGRSCEDVLVGMFDWISARMRGSEHVLGYSTDISGAFPGARARPLLDALERRGIPAELLPFIEAFLADQTVTVKLADAAKTMAAKLGLPQGSPLSLILWLYVNADYVDALQAPWSRIAAWVDDVQPLVRAKTSLRAVHRANILARRAAGWARDFGVTFEGSKGEATFFSWKMDDLDGAAPPPVVLQGQDVPYGEQMTILGCKLDRRLRPHDHVAYCARRASAAMVALARLCTSKGGVSAAAMLRVYEACIVPRMLWASATWYTPGKHVGLVTVLERVQRLGVAKVTGTAKIAGLAAQEVLAGTLPVDLRLRARTFAYAVRLRAMGPDHPLYEQVRVARRRVTKRHPSQMARLLHAFKSLTETEVETIASEPMAPWEAGLEPETIVPESKDDSVAAHDELLAATARDPEVIHVYTDGSQNENGYTGAGLAIRCLEADDAPPPPPRPPSRTGRPPPGLRTRILDEAPAARPYKLVWHDGEYPLGRGRTVYEGEVLGIGEGFVRLLRLVDETTREVHFWIDNQASIANGVTPGRRAAQQIVLAARKAYLGFVRQHPGINIVFHWVAGHRDVEGNERADVNAKAAADKAATYAQECADACKMGNWFADAFFVDLDVAMGARRPSADALKDIKKADDARKGKRPRQPATLDLRTWSPESAFPVGRSISDLMAEFKPTQRQRWDAAWRRHSTGRVLRAISPGLLPPAMVKLEQRHLRRRQYTVMSQLRIGFSPLHDDLAKRRLRDSSACACGHPREDRFHYLVTCPLWAAQRRELKVALRLPSLSLDLLGQAWATPAILDFVNATQRFPDLYCPVTDAQKTVFKAEAKRPPAHGRRGGAAEAGQRA